MVADEDAAAVAIAELSRKIQPLLRGQDPAVQGGVLADLLSIWLAGHIVPSDPEMTDKIRREVLELHVATVVELVPESEQQIFGGNFGTRR